MALVTAAGLLICVRSPCNPVSPEKRRDSMKGRSAVAGIVSFLSLLFLAEMAVADTGELCVHVTDNGEPVSDAVVTATCMDPGCDAMYTFDCIGEGLYCFVAMRAPHEYTIRAEKGSKSAEATRFVKDGPNLPDVQLELTETPNEPWEASTAEASTVYGRKTVKPSSLLNHTVFMLIPPVVVLVLRIRHIKCSKK
jgi:hypothetical protein